MPKKKYILQFALLVLLQLTGGNVIAAAPAAQPKESYRFIVAGHAYGLHNGTNLGLYPLFYQHLLNYQKELLPSFMILDGDIVRTSDKASWRAVEQDLSALPYPSYYVLGNHDDDSTGRAEMQKKFGGAYYAFRRGEEIFVILDEMQVRGNIPPQQLEFLKQQLSIEGGRNVFIFIHELIWVAHQPKYNVVVHNFGTYDTLFQSNFWEDVMPLLKQFPKKNIYIISGDVGGNSGAIPAFYEKMENIDLIATGMGGTNNENFLLVDVTQGQVTLTLIPINPTNNLQPLEFYNLETLRSRRVRDLQLKMSGSRIPPG